MRTFPAFCICISETLAYRRDDSDSDWNIFGFGSAEPKDEPTDLVPEEFVPEDPRDCSPTGCAGTIAAVYTYGAPGVASEVLRNEQAQDGCFPGCRTFNGDGYGFSDTKDPVSWIARAAGYKHPLVASAAVNTNSFSHMACSTEAAEQPGYDLRLAFARHLTTNYVAALEAVRPGSDETLHAHLSRFVYFGMLQAHNMARTVGYRLVKASYTLEAGGGKDLTYLFQEDSSLRCVLAFRGSDSLGDWRSNLWVRTSTFCGLEEVHGGFQAELRRLASTRMFQDDVRPALSKCSSVSIAGHSLGGAIAELYAYCVNRRQLSEEQRLMLGWTPSVPELMEHHCLANPPCDNTLETDEAPAMAEGEESVVMVPEMMQEVTDAFMEMAQEPVAGYPNGPGSRAWVSPSAADGWYGAYPAASCATACSNIGLVCTREGLHAHNVDVDGSEKVKALISRLMGSTTDRPCGNEYGSSRDVPVFAAQECWHSAQARALESFDCSHEPQSNKRRLCYCHHQAA